MLFILLHYYILIYSLHQLLVCFFLSLHLYNYSCVSTSLVVAQLAYSILPQLAKSTHTSHLQTHCCIFFLLALTNQHDINNIYILITFD